MDSPQVLAGRFELGAELGRGGMGTVYRAIDRTSGAEVALKTMNHWDPDTLLRFKNEFRAVADLRHPNLVRLGELVEAHGQTFFTMELVEGDDLLRSIRSPAGCDVERLRDALRQLVEGLAALHAANRVHRDVKPSNVLVTRAGRVVLVDFGLTARTVEGEQRSDILAAGTAAYMAPEQAAGRAVGPRADWYSVGVLLFEGLTGRLPVTGTSLEIMAAKLNQEPPSPDDVVPGVPADLAKLCRDLLQIDPAARPHAGEIVRRLSAGPHGMVTRRAGTLPQVGRRTELELCRNAYQDARRSGQVQLIVGPSGLGKTRLVHELLDRVAAAGSDVLVLSGRCHHRESIPFNAFDGVIDVLAKYLARLPAPTLERVLPRHPWLLGVLFPALATTPRLAEALAGAPAWTDPQEIGRRAFQALRELVDRMAATAPLVMVIDDLHHANCDSVELLAHLFRPPDPPRVLLIATARPGGVVDTLARLGADERMVPPRVIALPPLVGAPCEELARSALARFQPAQAYRAAEIAAQSGGNPRFLLELARSAGEPAGARTLDELVERRIAQLSDSQRRMLGMIAASGSPLRLVALAAALDLDHGEAARQLEALRDHDLISASGDPAEGAVEIFHDRVADTVLRRAGAASVRDWHARLATVLEEQEPDELARIVRHRLAAGVRDGIDALAAAAARRAAAGLEVHEAAMLYRTAIDHEADRSVRAALSFELAELLARLGDTVGAAARYQDAAELGGDRGDVELQRRAADQLVLGGHIPEAIELYRGLLAELEAPLPEHGIGALTRLVWHRWRARRALARSQPRRPAAPADRRRLDAYWSAGAALSTIDTIRGAEYQARYVALALRVGDDSQVGRGLALAAGYQAVASPTRQRESRALLERAAGLAERTGDPIDAGWVELGRAMSAYAIADFAAARPSADRAEEIFATCASRSWERRSARIFGVWASYFLGDVRSLIDRVRAGILDADASGDRFSGAQLRLGVANAVWLFADDPAGARRQSDHAIAQWAPPHFQMQCTLRMVDQAQTALYEGRPRDAHAIVEETWPALARSQLLRVELVGSNAWFLRGRVAVALAASCSGATRTRMLAEADHAIRRLRSGRLAWRHGLLRLLEAAVASVRGERDQAVGALDAAAGAFAGYGMTMHALAARHRHAQLTAGPPSKALAQLAAVGVRDPARWLRVLAPGFSAGD